MSFALVKFLNETDESKVVVQEVPSSWLSSDNKYCKWPPERYANIFISKQVLPEKHWEEHPVEVEGFFNSIQEAQKHAKKGLALGEEETLGRGQRTVKPTEYFSPAEEDERENMFKKKTLKKKPTENIKDNKMAHTFFMEYMGGSQNVSEINDATPILDVDDGGTVTDLLGESDSLHEESGSNKEKKKDSMDDLPNHERTNGNKGTDSGSASGSSLLTVSSGNDVNSINIKLDGICRILSELKIDIRDLKERFVSFEMETNADRNRPRNPSVAPDFPVKLPMVSLNDIDLMEEFLKIDENTAHLAKYMKFIGGHDAKDFTHRICKAMFSNSVALLCSWTGRKNNYGLEKLMLMKVLYDVVHLKCKVTAKEFEHIIMEWFRHAGQRKKREDKNTNVL